MHSQNITPRDLERFWPKVDTSPGPEMCWHWLGRHDPLGYGKFSAYDAVTKTRRPVRASRFAYLATYGDPPPNRPFVLHKCPGGSNAWCVNPAHLAPGDALENARDKIREGRSVIPRTLRARGERVGSAKLTYAKADEIRRELQAGTGVRAVARKYGVTHPTIMKIRDGQRWIDD